MHLDLTENKTKQYEHMLLSYTKGSPEFSPGTSPSHFVRQNSIRSIFEKLRSLIMASETWVRVTVDVPATMVQTSQKLSYGILSVTLWVRIISSVYTGGLKNLRDLTSVIQVPWTRAAIWAVIWLTAGQTTWTFSQCKCDHSTETNKQTNRIKEK